VASSTAGSCCWCTASLCTIDTSVSSSKKPLSPWACTPIFPIKIYTTLGRYQPISTNQISCYFSPVAALKFSYLIGILCLEFEIDKFDDGVVTEVKWGHGKQTPFSASQSATCVLVKLFQLSCIDHCNGVDTLAHCGDTLGCVSQRNQHNGVLGRMRLKNQIEIQVACWAAIANRVPNSSRQIRTHVLLVHSRLSTFYHSHLTFQKCGTKGKNHTPHNNSWTEVAIAAVAVAAAATATTTTTRKWKGQRQRQWMKHATCLSDGRKETDCYPLR